MVLAELGSSIKKALSNITKAIIVDDDAINAMLKEIATALLLADVNVKLVAELKNNVKRKLDDVKSGTDKRRYIKKVQSKLFVVISIGCI